ncbi:hypothetical protein LDENG_00069220 [Lucifuga dentata]|nr:hypothetical protein LDENG_00069220 [Lucifuga dentata]
MDCFSCQVCGKVFLNNRALQRHQRTHTGIKPHKCSLCGKGFNHLNRLKRHHLVHTKAKPFPCSTCNKKFSRKDRLKDHLNTHGLSAEALDREETSSASVSSHGVLMETYPERKAPDVTFSDDKHMTASAQAEPHKSVKTTARKRRGKFEAEELFSCTDCSKDFQSMYARNRHVREKHGKRLLHKCDCGQTFKANRSLIVHRRIYHPVSAVAVEPYEEHRVPKKYLCSTCGKEFPTSASLSRHLIIHSGKKPYKCTSCGRGFTQIGNLKTHQKVHKAKKFTNVAEILKFRPEPEETQSSAEIRVCHLCWTQFSDKQLLEDHMKQVHEAKKPFACTECSKRQLGRPRQQGSPRMTSKPQKVLQTTLSDSDGEDLIWDPPNLAPPSPPELSPPHPCSIISKKKHLSKREDVNEQRPATQGHDHSPGPGETVKRTATVDEPRSHELLQDNKCKGPKQFQGPCKPKKNYDCPTCGKVFTHNTALRRHLVIHSGKRPFKCFICAKGFTQSGNLKTHMKTHKEVPSWTLIQEKSPSEESAVTVHVCGECGMDFPQKHHLEEHRTTHKKPYQCPDCGKSFKNEYYFKGLLPV